MKRTPLKRGKGLARGCGVKRANPRRRKAAHARNFGDEADAARRLPCLVCSRRVIGAALGFCDSMNAYRSAGITLGTVVGHAFAQSELVDATAKLAGPSDPAHVTSRGAGGGRFDVVPLCRTHHDEQHATGVETFAAAHGLDLRAEADRVALLHEAPLGVRGLAQRWAAEKVAPPRFDPEVLDDIRSQLESGILRYVGANPANSTNAVPQEAAREALDTYELAALLGWVRRRMAAEVEARTRINAAAVADVVGFARDPLAKECDCLPANDREALAHAVMFDLGLGEDPHGEHGQSWALCEEAGWPS